MGDSVTLMTWGGGESTGFEPSTIPMGDKDADHLPAQPLIILPWWR